MSRVGGVEDSFYITMEELSSMGKREEAAILKLCLALFACTKVAVEVKLDILAAVIYMHSFK